MQNQILDLNEVSLEKLNKETKTKIESLCEKVYSKKFKEMSKDEVLDVIAIDLGMMVSELNISASSTRTLSQKYCTNNYYAGVKIDCSLLPQTIQMRLTHLSKDQIIDRYLQMRGTFYSMLKVKHEANEEFLRSLLYTAEQKDGATKAGRYDS